MRCCLLLLLLCLLPRLADAHQLQTVSLLLQEDASGQVWAVLKAQQRSDVRSVRLLPSLTPACQAQGSGSFEQRGSQVLRRWQMHCEGGLAGRQLSLQGLGPTAPDAVVSVRYASGETTVQVLNREQIELRLGHAETTSGPGSLVAYFPIGIAHILGGPDHLLFVLCLLLAMRLTGRGWLPLLTTVTAFTAAHSLTLSLAALGWVSLSSAPVEAVIALSILLLAVELARQAREPARSPGLSLRYPALVAFAFGLLHGFGFAGALADIGLPEQARLWALLLFNLGVEAGQLLFIAAALLLVSLPLGRIGSRLQTTQPLLLLLIGGLSAFWCIERFAEVLIR